MADDFNTFATLNVHSDDSHGFAEELRAFIEHMRQLGHHTVAAQVTHGTDGLDETTTHLVGGPSGDVAATDAVAASEPDAEAPSADAPSASAPVTQE